MKTYDSCIVGGGFAGLSAAIYLARFNRSCLVIDNGQGRWNTHEINENYLGFPKGISSRELRRRGLEQAKRFGAECTKARWRARRRITTCIDPNKRRIDSREQILQCKRGRKSSGGSIRDPMSIDVEAKAALIFVY